eukprot:TRINITY_DN5191_c0_g1_i2.p1 TRINITY_DN5191_c0_g1~~TRINITY_DN5191_c0_g1_i2.p1  ORF type:complete len:322 (+),score=67.65 TRINITY_DN5191_c0_g1_i2:285-1250(+)
MSEGPRGSAPCLPRGDVDPLVCVVASGAADAEADVEHTYGVVRAVAEMHAAAAGIPLDSWLWQWGDGPLRCDVRSEDHGVRYIRASRQLQFGLHGDEPLCRSFSTVAHEAGHACLDALSPDLYGSGGAPAVLHEAFADLTLLFLRLSQADVCGHAAEVGLRSAGVGVVHGRLWGGPDAAPLRHLDECSRQGSHPHSLAAELTSRVFNVVEAVWHFLCEVDAAGRGDAECLLCAARAVRFAFVSSVRNRTASAASTVDVLQAMATAAPGACVAAGVTPAAAHVISEASRSFQSVAAGQSAAGQSAAGQSAAGQHSAHVDCDV